MVLVRMKMQSRQGLVRPLNVLGPARAGKRGMRRLHQVNVVSCVTWCMACSCFFVSLPWMVLCCLTDEEKEVTAITRRVRGRKQVPSVLNSVWVERELCRS